MQIADLRLQIDCRLAIVLIAVITLAACAGAEQALLEQFFGASRLRDTTALQTVSTITFEPPRAGHCQDVPDYRSDP